MKRPLALGLVAALAAPVTLAETVITSWSGGSQFGIYFGGSTGDVVGYDFEATMPLEITDVGIWIDSTGQDSDHRVGVWRTSDMSLVADWNVAAGSGTPIDGFNYISVPAVVLPADTYTVGAMYTATDSDSYLSSATSITTGPEVNFLGNRRPSATSLGFVFPTEMTTSGGRWGPNFMYNVVPEPVSMMLLGLGGLALIRRRR